MKDKKCFIIGCGRSGTNLLYQVVRQSDAFLPSKNIEDRDIFNKMVLRPNYMTKVALERLSEANLIGFYMDKYPSLKLLFSFRHPYDVLASKMYRGLPKSKGGDNEGEGMVHDADPQVATDLILRNWKLWQELDTQYRDRVLPVKMEDLLERTEQTVIMISQFLGVGSNPKMFTPWKFNINQYQQRRYLNRKADQVNCWADRRSWNGAFQIFNFGAYSNVFKTIADHFNYELV